MRQTIAATVLALGLGIAPAAAIDMETFNEQIDQTNFIVDRGCSGTLVSLTHRLILTNAHCVDHRVKTVTRDERQSDGTVQEVRKELRDPVTVRQQAYSGHEAVGSSSYITDIVVFRKERDLAVLQMRAESVPYTEASRILPDSETVERGDRVYSVGNPSGLDATMVEGIVSSTTRAFEFSWAGNEELPMTQFSGGVWFGNSGGALYNDEGFLIGVPAAIAGTAHLGLAIPVETIKDVLREACFESVWKRDHNDEACRAEQEEEDEE